MAREALISTHLTEQIRRFRNRVIVVDGHRFVFDGPI